jgi:hypothetical protein
MIRRRPTATENLQIPRKMLRKKNWKITPRKFDDVFNTLARDIMMSVERKRRRLENVKS